MSGQNRVKKGNTHEWIELRNLRDFLIQEDFSKIIYYPDTILGGKKFQYTKTRKFLFSPKVVIIEGFVDNENKQYFKLEINLELLLTKTLSVLTFNPGRNYEEFLSLKGTENFIEISKNESGVLLFHFLHKL